MSLSRRITEHRSAVILTVLILLSLISLVTGTEASLIHRGVHRAVSVTAYPFLEARLFCERAFIYCRDFALNYHQPQSENEELKRELTELRLALTRSREIQKENIRLRKMLDFVREEPGLVLEAVSVIQSSKGMLTIDRGAAHGIRTSMCVITPEGVVGVVTEVGDFTASVATLHHAQCRIGAMVRRNRLRAYDGVIHAGGSDLELICTMEYIDMREKDMVRVGDLVVTSPESLFPTGYPIGYISAVHPSGSLLQTAEVVPRVDPYRLDEVFIIRGAQTDADVLAGPGVESDPMAMAAEPVPGAVELPDQRSIQERWAP